jgi:ketosteroid isomerase-like protein
MGWSTQSASAWLVGLALVSSCASESNDVVKTPKVVLESSQIEAWEATTVAFFDRFYETWPDLEARFSEFADDAVFFDPTFGDYWVGDGAIEAGWARMPSFFPELEGQTKAVFVSVEGAVFSVDWVGFWPGIKPEEVPWPAGLEVFRFDGDLVAGQDLWYTADTLEGGMSECGGCSTELTTMADRYVAAWSSGNAEQISSLYSEEASLSDSMFGIAAVGADEVSSSFAERFGSGAATMSIDEVFGITLGSSLTPLGSQSGAIVGVGIRYQWAVDTTTGTATVDSLTLAYFGGIVDYKFATDPQNLIVREEVFHNPDTLATLTP